MDVDAADIGVRNIRSTTCSIWAPSTTSAHDVRGNRQSPRERILLTDKHVKAVLINIFGGILRCDTLATGVVAAARDLNIQVPVVVRMEGTNVELGRKILAESGLNFTVAENMRDAAEKVVRLSN